MSMIIMTTTHYITWQSLPVKFNHAGHDYHDDAH